METARVAVQRGARVELVERSPHLGGLAAVAGPNGPIVEWLEREIRRLGVTIRTRRGADGCGAGVRGRAVHWLARRGTRRTTSIAGATVIDIADLRRGLVALPDDGDVVMFDPIGGPIAIALAEELGAAGDPRDPGPHRRQRAVTVGRSRARQRPSRPGARADRAAHRCCAPCRPARSTSRTASAACTARSRVSRWSTAASGSPTIRSPAPIIRAGDCVAPRTVHEAILEGTSRRPLDLSVTATCLPR